MSELTVALIHCEEMLLREISDPEVTRRSVAMTYALAIRSAPVSGERIDWAKVNHAIIARWSPSALVYIKRLAWNGKAFGVSPK